MGRNYGCRPSSFCEGLNELEAFIVDTAAVKAGTAAEKQAAEEARDKAERDAALRKHGGGRRLY